MAHFAEIDENNLVIRVLVTDNESQNEGYDWLVENLGGTWIQTSYNGKIRKNFAGIGFIFDSDRDAFLPPKPFNSWLLNELTCLWEAPVDYPTDGFTYIWNEDNLDWELADYSEFEE
jgi:hypothetical protein